MTFTHEQFKTALYALSPYVSDTADLIAATEDMLTALDGLSQSVSTATPTLTRDSTHDELVQTALNSDAVMGFVRDRSKIHAIKELRTVTGCDLRAAKDAIEDSRVWDSAE